MRLGQYPEALEIFKKLAELVPDDVRILLQLTELYYQSGDMDSARKVYKGIKASNHKAAQAFIQKHPDFKEE
ncbi:MAG: tetratricopeptide repeat protein [Deltaproteobacteria bacterium]|nr:tetratricopeptide repeat protein [Deltaproteobacteria bacterium]